MKLLLQTDDIDIQASAIRHAEDVAWFKSRLNLKPASTSKDLSGFLRDAGVKRMRLTKSEEKALGEFVRGEAYTDGIFKYYFVIFSKGAALLANEEATTSCILGYLQYAGLSEKQFEKDPVRYLELLGYRIDGDKHSLEEAGFKPSLKALHGKLEHVHKYTLGSDQLYVARFKTTTVVQYGSKEQLLRIYRDLGMIFSKERLERHVNKLLEAKQYGQLIVKLANEAKTTITVNRGAPNWATVLHEMSLEAGGFVSVELAS